MKTFVIGDNAEMGAALFSAIMAGANDRNAEVKAFSVSEPSRGSVSTILRFQYDFLSKMSINLMNWVYCKHTTPLCTYLLYLGMEDLMRDKTRDMLLQNCFCVDEVSALRKLVPSKKVSRDVNSFFKSPSTRSSNTI